MTQTTIANLINPEVMGEMISAGVLKNIKFLPLADLDTTLQARPGNTITVPKFAYIGDATDVAEGQPIDLTLLSATSTQVTVKKIGKGIELTDEAVLSGHGDPVGEGNKQLEKSITRKVDADCFTVLSTVTDAMKADLSTVVISSGAIADALVKFGEDLEGGKVLFVAPTQLAQIRKDPDFIKVSELKETIMNGVVGEIWGCQIVVSAKVVEALGIYTNYIVMPGAIGLVLKRKVEIEKDRDIVNKTNVVTADQHFVAYLKDDSKVVKVLVKK